MPWTKGQSGHPGGRPKLAKSITDALRKFVEKGEGEKIAKELIRLAQSAKQEAVRVKASEMVCDRLEGRPMQAIAMLQVMDDNTAKRLISITDSFIQASMLANSANVITQPRALTAQLPENGEST